MKFRTLASTTLISFLFSSVTFADTSKPITVTPKAGYYPIILENDTNDTPNITNIYLLALGKQLTKAATPCALKFTKETVGPNTAMVGTCTNISKSMNTQNYMFDLMKMPAFNKSKNQVLLYIPNLQSGRFYVSLNQKLTIPIALNKDGSVAGFQMPNLANISDKNYNVLYDKFEYTYDDTNTFWINPTSVDFFAIPITLVPNPLGYKKASDVPPNSGAPIGVDRHTLIGTMKNVLNKNDHTADQVWSKNLLQYDLNKTRTILRIASPQIAQHFPLTTYLHRAPFDYLSHLVTYYQDKTVSINVDELANNDKAKIYAFYAKQRKSLSAADYKALFVFTGSTNANGVFSFNNSAAAKKYKAPVYDTIQIDLYKDKGATSQGFFMPGQAPMTTPNRTVQSVIVKNLTAAFSAGLLPLPDKTLLTKKYYPQQKFYQPNTNNGKTAENHGPFYDLYSAAIHAHHAIPITYAYAYDDVLGQDGTLTGKNGIYVNKILDPSKTGPITIVLGDMNGIVIPSKYTPKAPLTAPTGVSNSGFKCSGDTCTLTATWKAPSPQAENTKYFIMPQNFSTSPAKIIQAQGLLFTGTSGTLKLNRSQVVTGKEDTKIQVFACESISPTSPDLACPSAPKYAYPKLPGSPLF